MRKIVVADDDPGSRHLLREILEPLRCEVSEAVDSRSWRNG
jgi:CheY-like chemotaxis protein